MKPRKLRRAGANWRLLVHRYVGGGRPVYDFAYNIQSEHWNEPDSTGEHSSTRVLAGTEFDELVVGNWAHLEQQDTGRWWMNIAGVTLLVHADRDGNPLHVTVFGPGAYAEPVEGCQYELTWDESR